MHGPRRMSGELVECSGELLSFNNAAMSTGASLRAAVHNNDTFFFFSSRNRRHHASYMGVSKRLSLPPVKMLLQT